MNNTLKNKLLFISRTKPFPVKGGDVFVLQSIMKALSESKISCDLLCYSRSKKDFLEIKEKSYFKNIYFSPIEPKFNLRCVFEWFFQQKSYLFNRFYSKKFSQKILELVKTGEYSTLVFEHAYMYTNLLFNPELVAEIKNQGIKTILNLHVLESFVFEQNVYTPTPLPPSLEGGGTTLERALRPLSCTQKFFSKCENNLLKKIEFECVKHADKTVFLSQEELERVKNILPESQDKFCFLPMTPFIENYQYSKPEFEEKNSIYFLGTYSWIQNSDAIKYFVKDIFPLILRQNPAVKLYLVGMNAGKDIKKLHDGKNIIFVGEVENVFEEIKKYSVLVAPVRIKGGTRIKIAEALCHGKAIVSTSAGIEGINKENPVIIADKPQDFAQKVLGLLSDNDFREKTKEHAINFAERYYNSEKFKNEVVKIFL